MHDEENVRIGRNIQMKWDSWWTTVKMCDGMTTQWEKKKKKNQRTQYYSPSPTENAFSVSLSLPIPR